MISKCEFQLARGKLEFEKKKNVGLGTSRTSKIQN